MLDMEAAKNILEIQERTSANLKEESRRAATIKLKEVIDSLSSNDLNEINAESLVSVGAAGAVIISECLKRNWSCKSLNFSNLGIDDVELSNICDNLSGNNHIERLFLDHNNLSCISLQYLANFLLNNTGLRLLSLEGNPLGCHDPANQTFSGFANTLSLNSSLRTLNLAHCGLVCTETDDLLCSLHMNTSLVSIDITGNEFTEINWGDLVKFCNRNRLTMASERQRCKMELDFYEREDRLSSCVRCIEREEIRSAIQISESVARMREEKFEWFRLRQLDRISRRRSLGESLLKAFYERQLTRQSPRNEAK
jgi:hypothetical protein